MQEGNSVLIAAAANGHADCVRLLLAAGADKEARNDVRVNQLITMNNILLNALLRGSICKLFDMSVEWRRQSRRQSLLLCPNCNFFCYKSLINITAQSSMIMMQIYIYVKRCAGGVPL
jgi:hypothetical protein